MNVKIRALVHNSSWIQAARLGMLIALGLQIPRLGLPQPITGPLVNALLILSVETMGVGPATFVGMVTPLSALLNGVLPLPLMAMIPFIALGNVTLIGLYGTLRTRNRWLALGVGAIAKFAWLYAAVEWMIARPLSVSAGAACQVVTIPAAVVHMMQWPQLATALVGGAIAFAIVEGARRVTSSARSQG